MDTEWIDVMEAVKKQDCLLYVRDDGQRVLLVRRENDMLIRKLENGWQLADENAPATFDAIKGTLAGYGLLPKVD